MDGPSDRRHCGRHGTRSSCSTSRSETLLHLCHHRGPHGEADRQHAATYPVRGIRPANGRAACERPQAWSASLGLGFLAVVATCATNSGGTTRHSLTQLNTVRESGALPSRQSAESTILLGSSSVGPVGVRGRPSSLEAASSQTWASCSKDTRASFAFASRAHLKHSSAIARYSAAFFMGKRASL